jgi:hypothetical protein
MPLDEISFGVGRMQKWHQFRAHCMFKGNDMVRHPVFTQA